MLTSPHIKALVPIFLLATRQALAQQCNVVPQPGGFSWYGLGSAGVHTKYKCDGNRFIEGSMNAPVDQSGRSGGGDGSYNNPGLFATAADDPAFSKCELIYVPLLKKYYRASDWCVACATDGHIDLWYGPSPEPTWTDATIPQGLAKDVGSCGGKLGDGRPEGNIIKNPPKDLEVSTAPLADASNCYTDRVFTANANSGSCSGSGSTGEGNGSPDPSPSAGGDTNPAPTNVPPTQPSPGQFHEVAAVEPDNGGGVASVSSVPDAAQPTATRSVGSILNADSGMQRYNLNKAVNHDPLPSLPATPNDGTEAVDVDTQPSASSTMSTSPAPTDSSSVNTTSPTTGEEGAPCPEHGWFPGCVWGSGAGKIGDSCTKKMDCWGEYICAAGKCADNTKSHERRRRGSSVHRRRHLGTVAHQGKQ